jgi:hypothetical protein
MTDEQSSIVDELKHEEKQGNIHSDQVDSERKNSTSGYQKTETHQKDASESVEDSHNSSNWSNDESKKRN